MMCPSCHAQLDDGARFCGLCGARLDVPSAAPEPLAPPVAPGAAAAPSGKAAVGLRGGSSAAPAPAAAVPAAGADPYIGTTLNNRFRIEAKLGEGGFGAVYRGTQLGIGRKVAIKLLHPEMARDKNLVARFRREGVVLCSLRDAHTITTYDFDQTPDGTLYIAMELLEGRSLHEVFHAEAPIDWRRMFKFVTEIATSLYEAHQAGIIHRDLKPENINLEPRPGNPEFVKVLDFGIAKVVHGDRGGSQSPQLTATGQTLGTLEYMSPEQLMGKDLDGRSDIYALGVVSYEMVTGRLPFPDAVGPAALISAQLRRVPDPPSRACPGANIPPGVDAVILKMLEKDRKSRFADVMELKAACEEVLRTGGQVPAALAEQGADATVALRPNAIAAAGSGAPPSQSPMPPPRAQTPPPRAQTPPPRAQTPPGPATGRAPASTEQLLEAARGSRLWLWIVLAMAAIGGGIGAFFALK
ncbi:MAG: serine/threonine protein kinase [Deltaproteobacteria bacterium]|nr:MAG: serine/threonine protein kinase [Deltaproteobacteria bacterium]